MNAQCGIFTISLDFELYWGVRDKRSIEQYGKNLLGVREAIPKMLQVFSNNNIHVTWATVGFLFFKDCEELNKNLPALLPTYNAVELSPYQYLKDTKNIDPIYHFAPELIKLILEHKGQELATHTFSHYYCLESGQNLEQFEADIAAAIAIAKNNGIATKSLVFPRNQWNNQYLEALNRLGIKCYRGNESSWIYKASDDAGQSRLQRAIRLLDAYINISGHNTYDLLGCALKTPFNFPASRFLRPYSKKLKFFEWLRLRRIKKAMTYAAINKQLFHLWWHPHNFGVNISENMAFLGKIIEHYNFLKDKYGMASYNMSELCALAEASRNHSQKG